MFLFMPLTCVYYPVDDAADLAAARGLGAAADLRVRGNAGTADRPCFSRGPDDRGAGDSMPSSWPAALFAFLKLLKSGAPERFVDADRRITRDRRGTRTRPLICTCVNPRGEMVSPLLIRYDKSFDTIAAMQQARAGIESMAIGEFGGAPALPGGVLVRRRRCIGSMRLNHAALNPARAFADATRLAFQNPINPFYTTSFGKSIVAAAEFFRALDAPLWPAGLGDFLDTGWRRARAGACYRGLGAAVLPASTF